MIATLKNKDVFDQMLVECGYEEIGNETDRNAVNLARVAWMQQQEFIDELQMKIDRFKVAFESL